MTILGINMLSFSTITRVYAFNAGLLPGQPGFYWLFRYFNLERGLTIGFSILLLGLILIGKATVLSEYPGFSIIGFNQSVRLVFGGSLATIIGGQTVFTSFVLSILGLDVDKE
jgi:hypothetical protein